MNLWDCCVEEALAKLGLLQLLRSLRPITPSREKLNPVIDESPSQDDGELEVFDEMQPWDRASVEIEIADSTFQKWLLDIPSSGMLPCFRCVGMGCVLHVWISILSFEVLQFELFIWFVQWDCI